MTGYIHLQLDFGTLEKMVKLLVICGAIPPRVWAEMDPQILCNPPKLSKRVWGMILELFNVIVCGYEFCNIYINLHIRMHKFNDICLREMIEYDEYWPLRTY